MGQFINSDCNTWKVSTPSPHCYFMGARKSSPSSTTVAAIKINTAVANTVIGAHLKFDERKAFKDQEQQIPVIKICYLRNERIQTGHE